MGMLSGDVEKLSAVRRHDFSTKSIKAIGAAETKFVHSPQFIIRCLRGMFFGAKPKLDARFIDEDKVRTWKDNATDGFVSTNDVITSTISQATHADILLMAINLRKRVDEADELDAGNYEGVIVHDAESSATPQRIRHTLQNGPPFRRDGNRPLPGFLRTTGCRVTMVTNWTFPSFTADFMLFSTNGEKSIPIQLHLPIFDPKGLAFPLAIIFRPNFGKIGLLYGGSPHEVNYDALVAAGAPIGEQVSSVMFPLD